MGGGASIPSASCNYLFCHEEIADGSKYICDDTSFRMSFVRYIQTGRWQDQVAKFTPKDSRLVISLDLLARERVCLMNEYAVPRGRLGDVYGTKSGNVPLRNSNSDVATIYSKACAERYGVDHAPEVEAIPGFTLAQTVSILFSILYPIYVAHVDAEDIQSGGLSSASFDSFGAFRLKAFTNVPVPDYAQRTCELMVTCARSVGEEHFDAELSKANFSTSVLEAFDKHALAITVVDATKDGFPIVYANKAFETLSGFTLPKLLAKNLLVLSGPDSEATQLALLHEAMSKRQSAKLGITCYKRGKNPFLNLLALRNCGRYSVAVHFPATKDADLSQLPAVDDLLTLLVMVLWHAGSQGSLTTMGATRSASLSPGASPADSPHRSGPSPRTPLALSLSMGGSLDSADTMPANQIRVAADGTVSQYVEPDGGEGEGEGEGVYHTQSYDTDRGDCCPGEGYISPSAGRGNDLNAGGKTASFVREGYSFGESATAVMSREMSYSLIQSVE